MENFETKQNTTEKIEPSALEKIRSGAVIAHSKNYFRLRVIALILVISLTFLVSIFLCSLVMFNLRVSGQAALIGFGNHGTLLFFLLFPWKLFLVNAVLIILSGLLLRSFRFGYKIPVLYLGIMFIIIMTIVGIAIDQVNFLHPVLLRNANNNSMPLFGGVYQRTERPPLYIENIYRGKIISVDTDYFVASIENGKECCVPPAEYKIILPASFRADKLKIGEFILIEGNAKDDTIVATEIEAIQEPPFFEDLDQ